MCDDARIESRIASVLTGSGLPMDRRAEIAEEMRCHLVQSIASKRESGLPDEEAADTALAEFGPPETIRKRLRQQQGMLDRRQALAEVRRKIWLPLAYALVAGILPGAFAPQSESLLMRFLAWTAVSTSVFVTAAGLMFGTAVFGYQIQRLRPRREHHFLRSCLRWMAVTTFGFMGMALFVIPMLASFAPASARRSHADPAIVPAVCQFLHNFAVAWMESAGRHLGLCALGVVAGGLGIAFYERSRCVDEPSVPALA